MTLLSIYHVEQMEKDLEKEESLVFAEEGYKEYGMKLKYLSSEGF